MPSGCADKVFVRLKREARCVRLDDVQDVLRDPSLNPHHSRLRNADRTEAPWCCRATPGVGALFDSKDSVRVGAPCHNVGQHFEINVSQMGQVRERENDGKFAVHALDFRCGCLRCGDDAGSAPGGTRAFGKLLRVPGVTHLPSTRVGWDTLRPQARRSAERCRLRLGT
jgi:hypothetical protein